MNNEQFWDELNSEIIRCQKCERLVAWREKIAKEKRPMFVNQEYWGKPVPGFGDHQAHLLIVGLAPGAHGANRTGRMFTGDASGEFLYRALHKFGLANQPNSSGIHDGLQLNHTYISAVCRCVPPDNKPTPQEIKNCIPYLHRELEAINPKVIVTLGRIAFDQMIAYFHMPRDTLFQHGAEYVLPSTKISLLASYHPSRQNTQTGRLTEEMFDHIWKRVIEILEKGSNK
ncbi:MAG: uracil-DNA glycosylase [Anaerolineales bacterium]